MDEPGKVTNVTNEIIKLIEESELSEEGRNMVITSVMVAIVSSRNQKVNELKEYNDNLKDLFSNGTIF